jgi:hypothetical protein
MRQSIFQEFNKHRCGTGYFNYEVKDGKRQGRSANIVGILRCAGKLPTTLRGCYQTRHSDFDFMHQRRMCKVNKFIVKQRNPLQKRTPMKETKELLKSFGF